MYRAGELTVIRIFSEAKERVRDVVGVAKRCNAATLQREVIKSRHGILRFLARCADIALTPINAPAVATLHYFRRLQVHSAMVLATELVVCLASEPHALCRL